MIKQSSHIKTEEAAPSLRAPISRQFIAMLLVSGTCIGGGMLVLPLSSSTVGYFPSLAVMLSTFLIMTISSMLFFEATLWFPSGIHVASMAERLLGRSGKWICSIFFIFICYASLIGYAAAGGRIVSWLSGLDNPSGSQSLFSSLAFSIPLVLAVVAGKRFAGRLNGFLFAGMIIYYIALVWKGTTNIDSELLLYSDWKPAKLLGLYPVMLTTFSIPGIVPTLTPYLNRDSRAMKRAIIGGLLLTLIIYIFWQTVVMGAVPVAGENGLATAYETGELASCVFQCHLSSNLLMHLINGFSIAAISTSFLGISLVTYDFLADSLSVSKSRFSNVLLALGILVPAVILGAFHERIFVVMMELTGGIGDAMVSIIIPALMVISGRYWKKMNSHYQFKGGKVLLTLLIVFGSVMMFLQIQSLLPH